MKPSQPTTTRESCWRSTVTTITRSSNMTTAAARVQPIGGGRSTSSASRRGAKVISSSGRMLPFALMGLLIASFWLPSNLVNAHDSLDALYFDQNTNGSSLLSTNGTNSTVLPPHKDPLFPTDLFTLEQRRNGAVVLHILGVIYMFVALAIVCDEFFVPSLDVIIEKLGITDDVAGATFMAAGGSAPELFTSVIGVFVSFDDVGIGTIVGSAVFNILFVIGMCALFSKTILTLTWWPLFRDCTFYSVSLLTLIYFFRDNEIYWWEALVLFIIYIAYAVFMKFNQQVERCVKKIIYKNKVTRVRSTDQLMPAEIGLLEEYKRPGNRDNESPSLQGNAANSSETSMATQPGGSVTSRAASESRSGPPGSSSGSVPINQHQSATGAKFRHGLLQLMIHTIDPLHDGKVDEKATQLHAIASLKVLLDATKPQRGAATSSAANHVKINLRETTLASDRPNGNIDTTIDSGNELEEEPPESLSMSWPKTTRKRITYLLVAPIIFPLYLTLPDTRTPRGKRFFPVTFIGSIMWIAAYSYLMVWWANVAGDTAKIPPEVMGLTFLAAGTSIPDLITSVIVARKGFGDMAVSSSVGSNIFDVTVGLPIPWLLYGIIYGQPVEVNSVGMVCSITILFLMLVFVILSIACFHWRMNKGLGLTMFLLYFVFVAVSLMFEYDMLVCPF
ncbi:sodium/potassium/calcium exchanger Nckx30C isoform X2 [Malaya genurostris]|uniref:sodium/potassium/calcium exchanger Nckx30C isoform X2 n=1 Tax=Malaya genurostris TaxID=325434 RepID=UPI0026F3F5CD|nr:sodium/potassium/calcium exchanger Nckx30C isoform X2 [Malaya genurostris]